MWRRILMVEVVAMIWRMFIHRARPRPISDPHRCAWRSSSPCRSPHRTSIWTCSRALCGFWSRGGCCRSSSPRRSALPGPRRSAQRPAGDWCSACPSGRRVRSSGAAARPRRTTIRLSAACAAWPRETPAWPPPSSTEAGPAFDLSPRCNWFGGALNEANESAAKVGSRAAPPMALWPQYLPADERERNEEQNRYTIRPEACARCASRRLDLARPRLKPATRR